MDCKLIVSLGFMESYLCKYVSKLEETNVNLVTVLTRLLDFQNDILTTISLSMILRAVHNYNAVRTISSHEVVLLLLQKPIYFTNFKTKNPYINNFREFNSSVVPDLLQTFQNNIPTDQRSLHIDNLQTTSLENENTAQNSTPLADSSNTLLQENLPNTQNSSFTQPQNLDTNPNIFSSFQFDEIEISADFMN